MKMRVNPISNVRTPRHHRLIGRDHDASKVAAIGILKEIVSRSRRAVEGAEVEAERRMVGVRTGTPRPRGREEHPTADPQSRLSRFPGHQNATPNPIKLNIT